MPHYETNKRKKDLFFTIGKDNNKQCKKREVKTRLL